MLHSANYTVKKLQLFNKHLLSAKFFIKRSSGDTKMNKTKSLPSDGRTTAAGDQITGRLGYIA